MPALVAVKGPNAGQRFALAEDATLIGRQPDAGVFLDSLSVSRKHARILHQAGSYFVEDVGSANGTYVNGVRISGRQPLTEGDTLEVGPYALALRADAAPGGSDAEHIIRARVEAVPNNQTLFAHNAAHKLQVVLAIAQDL